MEINKQQAKKPHSITIENRSRANLTGVSKVISSNENVINLETSEGGLCIMGSNFKINRYDLETGILSFEGAINQIKYSAAKVPLVKKIFK